MGRVTQGLDMVPVTPDDNTDLSTSGPLYIETGGVLKVHTRKSGGTVRTLNVPDNYDLKCEVVRVLATDTTATGIHVYTD